VKNQKDDLDLENVVQCCPEDPNLNLIGVFTLCDLKRSDFSGEARRLGVSAIITNIDLKSRGCDP